jgi:hypothetical protein
MAQQPMVGQNLHIIEASQSHSDTPQSVGLLWMSDRSVTQTTTQHALKRQISVAPAGLESEIPASERPQTQVLDCAVTEIG